MAPIVERGDQVSKALQAFKEEGVFPHMKEDRVQSSGQSKKEWVVKGIRNKQVRFAFTQPLSLSPHTLP